VAEEQGLSGSNWKLHHRSEGVVYFSNRLAQLLTMTVSRLAIELSLGIRPIAMVKMYRPSTPYSLTSKICLGLSRARAAHAGCVSICSIYGRRRVALYNAFPTICELSR
jgi:hypothetical protein